MRRITTALFLLVLAVLTPMAVMAQDAPAADACSPASYLTDVRPDPRDTPTEVLVGVRVIDVLDIDDVEQMIKIDMAVRMQWQDPRLAGLEGCRVSIRDIWFPEMTLANSGRVFSPWSETASIEANGTVTYLQRFSGTFASYHHLEDFPFDEQVITLRFYPLDWSSGKVVLRIDDTFAGIATRLNISDWDITDASSVVAVEEFEATAHDKSVYLLNVSADRHLGYYVWKIMLPIALIVFMSCAVFWIDPTEYGTQMGLSATSVLTMIAFIFGTTNLLPRLGYVTFMDMYIMSATVIVFLALLVTITTGYLAARGSTVMANRIDRASRMILPLGFVSMCTVFYVVAQ